MATYALAKGGRSRVGAGAGAGGGGGAGRQPCCGVSSLEELRSCEARKDVRFL